LDVDCHSSVVGSVKGNGICLSGGVPLVDSGTVGVEAEDLFLLFIAWPVTSFVVYVALSDGFSLCGNLVAYEPYYYLITDAYRVLIPVDFIGPFVFKTMH
jgi:hypothetical protein